VPRTFVGSTLQKQDRIVKHIIMAIDDTAFSLRSGDHETVRENVRLASQGNVRLRHHETDAIILIPTPSNDPNDPLNW